jgi:hypothetical protein
MKKLMEVLEITPPQTTSDWVCVGLEVFLLIEVVALFLFLIIGILRSDNEKSRNKSVTPSVPPIDPEKKRQERRSKVDRIKATTQYWLDAIIDLGNSNLPEVVSFEELKEGFAKLQRRDGKSLHFILMPHLSRCKSDEDFDKIASDLGITLDAEILESSARQWISNATTYQEYLRRYYMLDRPSWAETGLNKLGYEALEAVWDNEEGVQEIARIFCIDFNPRSRHEALREDEKDICPVYLKARERLQEFRLTREIKKVASYTLDEVMGLFSDLEICYRGTGPMQALREPARQRALALAPHYSFDELARGVNRYNNQHVVEEIRTIMRHKVDSIDDVDYLDSLSKTHYVWYCPHNSQYYWENTLKREFAERAASRRMSLLRAL